MERRLLILFASETGCAQDFAEELGREGKRIHLDVEVLPMDEYSITNLPRERLVLFVVATTGQGDMPHNATKSWRFLLRKNLPSHSLQSVRVGLCGLGDSGYKEFNFAAKKLYRRLLQLSAKFIIEPGYGDDQSKMGPYEVLDPWKDRLVNIMQTIFPIPPGKQKLGEELYIVTLSSGKKAAEQSETPIRQTEGPFTYEKPFMGELKKNQRLTEENWGQDVRHYEINIDPSMNFKPGDALAVLPCNPHEEVVAFLHRVQLSEHTIIESISLRDPTTKDTGPKSIRHLTFPMTLGNLFEKHLDIMGTPRRYFFQLLSYFAPAEHEKERLCYFSSSEAQDELRLYSDKEKKSIREILEDFPSALPPLEYLLDLIPPIQPRLFSIASSFKLFPNQAHLLVATVSFTTPLKRKRVGLCTNFLSKLAAGDKMRVWIKAGSPHFHLPLSPKTPVIMIGPGTGLAPFRSFIQERVWLKRNGEQIGWSSLYTGCRHKDKDWYYGEELNNYVIQEALTKYYVAFSRDNVELKKRKTYVQHLMLESSEEIWQALHQGGSIFLSGSALVMPQSVKEALLEIIVKEGKMSEEDAEQYFRSLELSGRFTSETWQ